MCKVIPKDQEYFFDEDVIISQTDAEGIITYVNRVFCKVSGYENKELIGQPHSIVRHPDMPKEIFHKMWKTIQSGQAWNGLIKNLRKDGHYYWINTEILPIKDNNNEITGYIAAKRAASRKDIQENEQAYSLMFDAQG